MVVEVVDIHHFSGFYGQKLAFFDIFLYICSAKPIHFITKNHTMEEKMFDFNEVPASWQLCFNRDCPRCEGCLRFVAGRHVPADHEWGPAVYPSALGTDGQCRWYRTAEPQQAAWGFVHAFDNVRRLDFKPMRYRITAILGSKGVYYDCRNGLRPLMPDQQVAIAEVFTEFGYEPPRYERYGPCFDFR